MSRTLTTFLSALLTTEWQRFLPLLARLIPYFRQRRPHGLYEVLSHRSTLELLDSYGKRALYRKVQRVRFSQDGLVTFQDMAWGEGDIFASYECSPGLAVDCYREGVRVCTWQPGVCLVSGSKSLASHATTDAEPQRNINSSTTPSAKHKEQDA